MYKLNEIKYIPNDIRRLRYKVLTLLKLFWINKIYLKYFVSFEEYNTPYQEIVGNFEYDKQNRDKQIVQKIIKINDNIIKVFRTKLEDICYYAGETKWDQYTRYWTGLVEKHKEAGTLIQICEKNIPLIKSFYTNKKLQKN